MKSIKQIVNSIGARLYYYCCPDKIYLNNKFKKVFGRDIDWKNPTTFNEKLQWLKIYDRNPLYTKLVDKYEVRKYIADKIGEEYLIPCLGVWNKFEEIDFDKLPNQFVLKCTHDSNSVVVCRDKSTFDIESARKRLDEHLHRNFYYNTREWPYKNVIPRIIAEQYMEDKEASELRDYKFFCFNGKVKFLYLSQGLENHNTARISYVTLDWKQADFYRNDYKPFDKLPQKPVNFDKMIIFAEELSKNISFLRVDFYEVNGKIYFGELTFYTGSGFVKFMPETWDHIIGEWFSIRKYKKFPKLHK